MLAWPPRHASRAGKPLHMFSLPRPFPTQSPVRHLDPRSSTINRAQRCVRCKIEPTIELSVGLERTNQYTLLTWKSAMRASEKIARDPQVWSNPVGLGVRSERGLLRKRVFTADKEALFSRSTLFNSASSRNSQPKDSFPVSLLLLGEDKW